MFIAPPAHAARPQPLVQRAGDLPGAALVGVHEVVHDRGVEPVERAAQVHRGGLEPERAARSAARQASGSLAR